MQRVQTPEDKLSELEITLPAIRPAVGNYVSCVRVGNLLFTAGQGVDEYHGKLGKDISIDEGYKAARQSMLNLLSVVRNELGDLNKVKRIVKILGFVNSTEDFINQPKVMNGASDVLVDIFGEKGNMLAQQSVWLSYLIIQQLKLRWF